MWRPKVRAEGLRRPPYISEGSGRDAEVRSDRAGGSGVSVEAGEQKVLLERGIGLLGGREIAGLQGLAELAEESGYVIGGLAGIAGATVVVMMVRMAGALLMAELLHVLLGGGEIGLRGIDIAGLQIPGELGDGSRQRVVILRGESDGKVLRICGEKRLQGGEIVLRLGEVARLQVLREVLKTLLELVRFAVRGESVKLGNDGIGDTENGHACLL